MKICIELFSSGCIPAEELKFAAVVGIFASAPITLIVDAIIALLLTVRFRNLQFLLLLVSLFHFVAYLQ